jgi:hypothetical protein
MLFVPVLMEGTGTNVPQSGKKKKMKKKLLFTTTMNRAK